MAPLPPTFRPAPLPSVLLGLSLLASAPSLAAQSCLGLPQADDGFLVVGTMNRATAARDVGMGVQVFPDSPVTIGASLSFLEIDRSLRSGGRVEFSGAVPVRRGPLSLCPGTGLRVEYMDRSSVDRSWRRSRTRLILPLTVATGSELPLGSGAGLVVHLRPEALLVHTERTLVVGSGGDAGGRSTTLEYGLVGGAGLRVHSWIVGLEWILSSMEELDGRVGVRLGFQP